MSSSDRPLVNEVADRVFMLGTEHVHWYVVVDGESITVVDTGLPGYWPQLEGLLSSLGRLLSDIEAVLLTHADPDHLGNAERIAQEAGATVFIHELDRQAAMKQARISPPRLPLWRPAVLSFIFHGLRNGLLRWPALTSTVPAGDGDQLEVPGRPRVIHVPGHTAGSLCFAFDDRDALMVGDALVNKDPVTGRPGCIVSTEAISADHAQALESIAVLSHCTHKTVLFGHGGPCHKGILTAAESALG